MCGIAGILSYTELDELPPSDSKHARASSPNTLSKRASNLKDMQDALLHRGPDGKGAYFSPSNSAALAHTRLSIIDTSNSGHQPMSSNDKRYTITYDGEIYNYKKLRSQLELEGEKFESTSDTEVILKLFIKKGTSCVQLLRGMFAFVIWDEKNQSAFAARDAMGIKPLYYLSTSNTLVFASELRSVLASGYSSKTISGRGIKSYLVSGSITEPYTAIKNVKMLPAGNYFVWKANKISLKRFWNLEFKESKVDQQKAMETTRGALEHSIRAHLVSDVPIGIFLDGEVSSTAIVAIASKISKKQLNTYSLAFEDSGWNEAYAGKRVAEQFNTNHTELLITEETAKPLFDQFLKDIDQPSIGAFHTYCLSKLAKDNGEKVALSGLGGNELFAGCSSFEDIPEMVKKPQSLAKLNFIISPLSKKLIRLLSPQQRKIIDVINNPNSLVTAHQSFRGSFSSFEADTLTSIICKKTPKKASNTEPKHRDQANNICTLELQHYLRNQLLRDSDAASMAWGLELRVPLIDRVFIDQISVIPANIRLQSGKKLLIESVPELPSWVIEPAEQELGLPVYNWLESHWRSMPMPSSPSWIHLKPKHRRWSLAVLNDWVSRHAN